MESVNLPVGQRTFSLEDFKLSPEQRAEICQGLTERQTFMVNRWMDIHDCLNTGSLQTLRDYCDVEKFSYGNPNRPDLGSFESWVTSPEALITTFPPCVYRTLKAWGSGDDEVCVLCHHYGKQTGGPYMGVQPQGQEINVMWFSWLKFEGDKIVHIYSVADVLGMFKDIGVIEVPQPVDPYK